MIDFEKVNEYEVILKQGWIGFAEVYLDRCSKISDEFDLKVYAKLIELDAKLGTKSSEQLARCLYYTCHWNIIKVIPPYICQIKN